MTPLTTLRAQLPCPCCGQVGSRTVALQAPSPSTELREAARTEPGLAGPARGLVSDCEACWSRRADRIAAARRRLAAGGELSSLGSGREDAWQGVPLSRCEDAYASAFASAVMKVGEGAPLPPSPIVEALELVLPAESSPDNEPELVKA